MDADKFALVEKIIKDIENIMSKNAELYAFDIVPVDINFKNKSPVLHLENCLGLESWCIKHVYMYCYSELLDKYISKPKRNNSKLTFIYSERLISLLNLTLLLNPDLSTLWNKRRDLVLKSLLEKSSELQFTKLVLSRKPKCNDAFAYRRWLLEQIFQDETKEQSCIQNLVNEELHICETASDKSPNNYHSWNHRIWILNTIKSVSLNLDLLYVKEYAFSECWTAKHISDHSYFHYRQFCIKNVFKINNDRWSEFQSNAGVNVHESFVRFLIRNFPKDVTGITEEKLLSYSGENLITLLLCSSFRNCNCNDILLVHRKIEVLCYELVLNTELLCFYKNHETLWYHRRYVIHEIMSVVYNYFGLGRVNGVLSKVSCVCNNNDIKQKQPKILRYDNNQIYSSVLFRILFSHEKKFVAERMIESDNYADRHEKYLKFVEGWNNII